MACIFVVMAIIFAALMFLTADQNRKHLEAAALVSASQ